MLIILEVMLNLKKVEEYPIKKCKGFGYTFTLVFFAITIYFFKIRELWILFIYFVTFFSLNVFFTCLFEVTSIFMGKVWYIFRKIFSPVVLTLIYIFTILRLN